MKLKIITIGLFAFLQMYVNAYSQTFKSIDKAKQFFEKFDDEYNKAMENKDSLVFARQLADNYINCTPDGTLNNKKAEISTLLALPVMEVVRAAPQFEIFTYSDNLATFSVVKKITFKGPRVTYVRRTTIYHIINGKWQAVSGQGTTVPAKFIE